LTLKYDLLTLKTTSDVQNDTRTRRPQNPYMDPKIVSLALQEVTM